MTFEIVAWCHRKGHWFGFSSIHWTIEDTQSISLDRWHWPIIEITYSISFDTYQNNDEAIWSWRLMYFTRWTIDELTNNNNSSLVQNEARNNLLRWWKGKTMERDRDSGERYQIEVSSFKAHSPRMERCALKESWTHPDGLRDHRKCVLKCVARDQPIQLQIQSSGGTKVIIWWAP